MNKILLTIALCTTTLCVNAQITVTNSDMPNAGDSILVSVAGGGTGGADPALTGPSYSWDYSALVPTIQRWEKFDSPFGFTTPFNILFNPLNCSYGKDNYQLTTIPLPGVTLTDPYDFFKESSSNFKQIGSGYTINGIPLPFLYTASDYVYRFPMNYGNTDSCDYKFGLPIPTIGYYGQTGHRVNLVDGWGTLITPSGTYNTLRVISTIAAVDTIEIDAFGFGTNVPRPLQYQYKWLANGKEVPVLEIDANDIGGTITVTNVQYIDTIQPGVPQVGIAENANNVQVTVFPNPFNEQTTFTFSTTSADKIILTDVTGKLVATENVNGMMVYSLNRNKLKAGFYFYSVLGKNKNTIAKGKLIIQ